MLKTSVVLLCAILGTSAFKWRKEYEVPDEFWDTWQGYDSVNSGLNLENLTELCKGGRVPFIHIKEFTNNLIQNEDLYDLVVVYSYKDNLAKCVFCEQALKSLALLAESVKQSNQDRHGRPLFTIALDVEGSKMTDAIPLEHLPLIYYFRNETMNVYSEDDFSVEALRAWLEKAAKLQMPEKRLFNYKKFFIRVAVTVFALVFGYLSLTSMIKFAQKSSFWALLAVSWIFVHVSGFMFIRINKRPLWLAWQREMGAIYPTPHQEGIAEMVIIAGLCKFLSLFTKEASVKPYIS